MRVGTPRPTNVTVLAVLAIILGVFSILSGLEAILLGFVVAPYVGFAGTFLLGLGPVGFVSGLLGIVYGIGFLKRKGWSWTLGMVVAFVSLVSSIVLIGLLFTSSPVEVIGSFVAFLFSLTAFISVTTSSVTIFFLTRPHVKAFFGRGPATETHAKLKEVN